MMDLLTKQGQSKLVQACTYPLTGMACVKRIYTDLATLACTPNGLVVIDAVEGLELEVLSALIGLPLTAA
jgi:3-oxoadipate CoA-transferase beta subunit